MKDLFLSILQEDYSDDVITVKKLPGGIKLVSRTDNPEQSATVPERNFGSINDLADKIGYRGGIPKNKAREMAIALYKRKEEKLERERRKGGFKTKTKKV